MTPPFLRTLSRNPLPAPARRHEGLTEFDHCCGDNRQLRQEYIDRLAEFNDAAARHQAVRRAGMAGAAFDSSWRRFQERCAASREAWSRYREHVAMHGCKRA